MNRNQIPMVDNVRILSVEQAFDDRKPNKIWTVGDEVLMSDGTTVAKIIEFRYNAGNTLIAVTDTPSEWQKKEGAKNGWSWIFQLKSPNYTKQIDNDGKSQNNKE